MLPFQNMVKHFLINYKLLQGVVNKGTYGSKK